MDQYVCNDRLWQHVTENITNFNVLLQKPDGYKKAAVCIIIADIADDPGVNGMVLKKWASDTAAVILTRRSFRLKKHSGQWALPGGIVEPNETIEEAALRELREEVGLKLESTCIIGCLDDFITRSGFIISPVVIWGGSGLSLAPNPSEVSSIHRIPIKELMRKDAPFLDEMPQSPNPVLRMPVGNSYIASPTGAILYQFREVAILGRDTRVAHYEQPYFAWQ